MSDDKPAAMWEVVEEKTQDHCLEIRDPQGWWEMTLKWDGCCDLHQAHNTPFPVNEKEVNQYFGNLHICDLNEFIKRLELARDMAQSHFGGEGEWSDEQS